MNKQIEMINSIESKEDFIEFLKELREDYENNFQDWGNNDLPNYL